MAFHDDRLIEAIQESVLERIESGEIDAEELSSYDVNELTRETLEEVGREIYEQVVSDDEGFEQLYETREGFEQRLADRWGEPLELLERLIFWSREIGESINREYRLEAAQEQDFVFDALTRLHARAAQMAMEIHRLLTGGFADGAFARWRSLHELAITASVIRESGQETAERFLAYRYVWEYYFAQTYQEHSDDLEAKELDAETLEKLEAIRDDLVEQFGASIDGKYGSEWAAKALDQDGGPSLHQLAEEASLDHYYPFYRLASESLHGGSKGTLDRLGLIDLPDVEQPNVLLSGPSNAGLALPGQLTAVSLSQITFALIEWQSSAVHIAEMQGMRQLLDNINHDFTEKAEELYEDERAVMQEWADQDIVDIALNYLGSPALFVDAFFREQTAFDSPDEFEEELPMSLDDITDVAALPDEVDEVVAQHSDSDSIEELIEAAFESWVRREVIVSEFDME